MSLKIALVTGEYPPMEGGVGAFTRELGKALAGLGHELHVITSQGGRPKESTPSDSTLLETWNRLNDRREPLAIDFGLLHPRARRWRWGDMGMIADLTERYSFDVVNIQYQAAAFNMRSPAINFLPWRLSSLVPTVVTFHDLRVPYLFPKAGRLRPWVVRTLAEQAQGAITTNRVDFEQLTAAVDTPVRQIPIGSNISVFQPNHIELQEAREGAGLNEDDIVLGYFGFLNESKGADLLLTSLTKLSKKINLVFIGGRLGSSDSINNRLFDQRLEQMIKAYGLDDRVHFTGFLSDTRVSTLLNICDLIVLPYRDGVSLRRGTLMAALAHGRPVISTEPELPLDELRHGENIWLVPAGEADPLAAAIKQLLGDQPLRERLGAAARQTSRRFSWEHIAGETAAFFEELHSRQK